ncbi:MAG: FadR/GntR family transcriptional regulator [Bosea sp. (in: a-proteobacteria)]
MATIHIREFARPTTLNQDRLFGQVAQVLAVAIISGQIPAGEQLPDENGLKGQIDVSRGAYREAVKVLTAKGLVEARPKSGTRAAPRSGWNLLDPDVLQWHFESNPDEKFIRDLFELRRFTEPTAARLAALRRTEEDMGKITQAFRGMSENPPYQEAAIRADLAFHDAIFMATHNDSIRCLASVVTATIQWSMVLQSVKDKASFTPALNDHQRVHDAILRQDGDMASACMATLVIESLNDTLAMLLARRALSSKSESRATNSVIV